MTQNLDSVQDISLTGKSGTSYNGSIYTAKNSGLSLTGKGIVCLSNSEQNEEGWTHKMNAVYNTDDMGNELAHFDNRDDISHLILIPQQNIASGVSDPVDDLIRNYIHR